MIQECLDARNEIFGDVETASAGAEVVCGQAGTGDFFKNVMNHFIGREILAKAKNLATIPFAASIAKLSQVSETAERFAELEIRASDIFGLSLDTVTSAQKDYRAKIMIDME